MRFRVPLFFTFSIVLALTLFLGVLLSNPHFSTAAGETAVVAVDVVNVRSGPGTDYEVISQVGLDECLPVLAKSGDWYNVQLATGKKGWVAGWLVNIEKPQAPAPVQNNGQIAVVNGSYVNIRGGPSTDYDIIAQAGSGERFPVLEKSGDWFKIRLNTGTAGWVAGWLITLEADGSSISQSAPPVSRGSQTSGKTAVVTGSVVNVRSGPGTSIGVVGQVFQGDKLSILEQSGDWYRVMLPGGGTGWVAGWLVSVQAVPSEQVQPPVEKKGDGEVAEDNNGSTIDDQSSKALSLKVRDAGGKTSAIIEANAPFDYTSFSLKDPERLVLDLKGIAIGDLPQSTEVNSKTMRQVRTGYFQKNPDVTRVVFELTGGAQYVASLSTDKKILTIQTYIPDITSSYIGKVIAIDPGHGGPDPGAIGSKGTKEKEVTLDVSKRVAKLLESRGAKVIMTRSSDQDMGLYQRTDKANYAKADIFVSIHINAHTDSSFGGTSTFIYNGNGDRSQTARIQESGRLARYVQAELVKTLGLRDVGVKDANFAVLRTSNMPAILTELAFISNLPEEKYINTDIFRNGAAEAIVKGIGLYFSERRSA